MVGKRYCPQSAPSLGNAAAERAPRSCRSIQLMRCHDRRSPIGAERVYSGTGRKSSWHFAIVRRGCPGRADSGRRPSANACVVRDGRRHELPAGRGAFGLPALCRDRRPRRRDPVRSHRRYGATTAVPGPCLMVRDSSPRGRSAGVAGFAGPSRFLCTTRAFPL